MSRIDIGLVRWGLLRKPLRTLILIMTVVGSLTAYVCTETVMRDTATQALESWRSQSYELEISVVESAKVLSKLSGMAGIARMEEAIMFEAMIGTEPRPVAVPAPDSQLLDVKLTAGRAPQSEDEIAVTDVVASAQVLKLGDWLQLAPMDNSNRVVSFRVTGIASGQQGSAQVNSITAAGAARLFEKTRPYEKVVVRLDGTLAPEVVLKSVKQALPGAFVTDLTKEPEVPSGGLDMAEGLISLTRGLLILVTIICMFMLFLLGQQERSYELGVLRAMGFSRLRIMSVLLIEATLILLLGVGISLCVLVPIMRIFQLGGWQQCLRPAALLAVASLATMGLTASEFVSRPVTLLLKDR